MRIAAFAPVLALAALVACPTPSQASPRFTQMNVALNTLDKGKGADTRVEISIVRDAGGPAVAYLDIQGLELAPYGTVQEVVPSSAEGFTLDQLKHMHVEAKVSGGPGVWRMEFDAVLHFDDDSQALLGSGKLSLSGARPVSDVPLSLATVARSGLFGGVAKLGFKLMSKSASSPEPVAAAPHKSAKDFTHMDLAITSGERGAESGTRVEISIAPKAGGPAVAYLDVQDRSFPPYEKVPLIVPPAGDGFRINDLKNEEIVVRATTPGGGTWTCKFDAIVHFADGTQALLGSGDLRLSGARNEESVPLSLAAVAHPSLFGGVEKLGFKLLSKGSVTQTPDPLARSKSRAKAGSASAASPGQAPAPQPQQPMAPDQFTGMDVKLWSGHSGKDSDTRVEISIVPRDGGDPVAYLDIQGQAIGPGRSVNEVVPPAGQGFTAATLKDQQVVVKITAPGHCTWTHGLDIAVHFADGSAALWSTGDLVLTNYSTQEAIPLSEATVAKGFLGGVKKFGFGVLNTLGK